MNPADLDQKAMAEEARRLAALHALALLDSEPEREFDALVALAAQMLDVPVALLTLVDRDRQWVKARQGIDLDETPRSVAFCDHTIRTPDPMIVDDAMRDPRFVDNALVTGDPHIRFYAGAPIHTIDASGERHAIGALCVIDSAPRSLNEAGRRALSHLATLAETAISARATAQRAIAIATTADQQASRLSRHDRIFRQAERMAAMGAWRMTLADNALEWSNGVYRIHDLPIGQLPAVDAALDFYPPKARAAITEALARTIETGAALDLEVDFVTANRIPRRVRTMAEVEMVDGRPVALVGVFQDVTERHALEVTLRRSADTDSLTGLANRAAFERALDAAMTRAHGDDSPLLLALVDLDGFKAINDTLGHTAGDDVLRGVGRSLQAHWLKGCIAARLGGDEFAVIIDDVALARDPALLCIRLEEALRVPVRSDSLSLVSAGTVGIAALEPDCHTVRDFVHRADTILYAAKRARVGNRRRTERRSAA